MSTLSTICILATCGLPLVSCGGLARTDAVNLDTSVQEAHGWEVRCRGELDSFLGDATNFHASVVARKTNDSSKFTLMSFDSLKMTGSGQSEVPVEFDFVQRYSACTVTCDFESIPLSSLDNRNTLLVFGTLQTDSSAPPTPIRNEFQIDRHRERYIALTETPKVARHFDQGRGLKHGGSYRGSDRLRVWNYYSIGTSLHSPQGAWTYSISWPLFERMKVDSIWYLSSIVFPATYAYSNSWVFGLLTPDIEIQRNLTRTHKAKLFVGIDALVASNNYHDGETTTTHWVDGIVVSPKAGFQWRVWALQLRAFGSLNYWVGTNNQFRDYRLDLGPTIGFSIWSGPEFLPQEN